MPGHGRPDTATSRPSRMMANLRPGDHLCCIYETEEEHRAAVTPFLRQGLEQDQKVIYIVDAYTAEIILGYLRDDGLEVEPYLARGQLVILTRDETYVREGVFDPERMIAMLRSETKRALAEGYPALRVTGEMAWALRGLPGSERLIEYEARLNEFFPGSQCLAICQYDSRRFDPAVLLDVLRSHPIAVVGTEVYDNFYYIPTPEMLNGDLPAAELRYWLQNLVEGKRAQEQIRQQNEFLNTVLESLTHPFYVVDTRDYTVKVANPAARWGGLSAGTTCYAMTHRSDKPCETAEHPCPLEEMKRTKRPAVVEHLHYDADGHVRHVEVHSYPILDGEGNVSQAIEYSLDITERQRMKETLEQSERALKIRNKIANVFLTASKEKMYEQVLQIILEAVESGYGVFGYIDEAGDLVAPSMTGDIWDECQIPDKDIVFPRETWGGIWGRAMIERKTHYSNAPFRVPEGHIPMLRAVAVPIVYQGELIGLIEVANKVTDYDEKDREQLESIVDSIAPVLHARLQRDIEERARRQTQEALRQHAERLQTQHQIDQAILAAESPESIAQAALHYMQQMVPCQRASITVFDFEGGEMSQLGVRADAETQLGQGWRGPLEWAWFIEELRQGKFDEVEDLQPLSPLSPLAELLQAEGVRCHVSVPLIAEGELMGSLNVGMHSPGRLTPEQMDIVCEVASQVAVAIRQAHLHEQVQRHADELEVRVAERTAALRRSEARFRVLFEEAALGIALVDMEGRLVEGNPALQRMLGYSGEELRSKVFTEFTHPDDVEADLDLYRELIAGKRDQYKLENRYVRKDGQMVWANLTASLIRGAEGQPRFVIGMIEDITQQKQTQAALLQAEQLAIAGKLAASLAHEINNPLQSVIGCLGLAQETLAEGRDVSQYLQVAHEELQRAARIVAQLRDLHRASRREERKPTDVNALLEQVLVLSRKQCEERGVDVVWETTTGLPPLVLAPDRMQQVFLNLLLNAIDAMAGGGRLQVRTIRTTEPAGVRIVFTDSGVGIPPDVASQIFDPFFSTKPEGLGLGLFISRDIVERHGGRIEAHSQAGEGTTFTVWLPA